jgi:hypothetical protein
MNGTAPFMTKKATSFWNRLLLRPDDISAMRYME